MIVGLRGHETLEGPSGMPAPVRRVMPHVLSERGSADVVFEHLLQQIEHDFLYARLLYQFHPALDLYPSI